MRLELDALVRRTVAAAVLERLESDVTFRGRRPGKPSLVLDLIEEFRQPMSIARSSPR